MQSNIELHVTNTSSGARMEMIMLCQIVTYEYRSNRDVDGCAFVWVASFEIVFTSKQIYNELLIICSMLSKVCVFEMNA